LDEVQRRNLDELTRTILYRNVRELLANVVKHSKATSLSVLLETAGDQLAVTVRDDGEGCDPAVALGGTSSEGGFGLFSIRERMTNLGGALGYVFKASADEDLGRAIRAALEGRSFVSSSE